jgi:hypothetical protein
LGNPVRSVIILTRLVTFRPSQLYCLAPTNPRIPPFKMLLGKGINFKLDLS